MKKFKDKCDTCGYDEFNVIRIKDDVGEMYVELRCPTCGGNHYA